MNKFLLVKIKKMKLFTYSSQEVVEKGKVNKRAGKQKLGESVDKVFGENDLFKRYSGGQTCR